MFTARVLTPCHMAIGVGHRPHSASPSPPYTVTPPRTRPPAQPVTHPISLAHHRPTPVAPAGPPVHPPTAVLPVPRPTSPPRAARSPALSSDRRSATNLLRCHASLRTSPPSPLLAPHTRRSVASCPHSHPAQHPPAEPALPPPPALSPPPHIAPQTPPLDHPLLPPVPRVPLPTRGGPDTLLAPHASCRACLNVRRRLRPMTAITRPYRLLSPAPPPAGPGNSPAVLIPLPPHPVHATRTCTALVTPVAGCAVSPRPQPWSRTTRPSRRSKPPRTSVTNAALPPQQQPAPSSQRSSTAVVPRRQNQHSPATGAQDTTSLRVSAVQPLIPAHPT